ncbi:HAD family hydrolase [Frateuria aurantia]
MTALFPATSTIVLFDFDGTLVDSTPAVKASLQLACESMGAAPPDPVALDAAIAQGVLMGDLFRLIHPRADSAEIARWLEAYREAYRRIGLDHSRLFPGAVELLQTLRQAGYRLTIVSNKSEPSIHVALQHFGLAGYFEHVWGEQADMPGKPQPDLFVRKILPAFPQASRSNFLMIGDTVADRDFAAASGVHFCLVAYGYGEVSLNGRKDCFKIHALNELPHHLQAARSFA